MRQYQVKIFGSIGVRSIEYETSEMGDNWAISSVERAMKHYFPVYTSAAIWRDDELIAEFSSQITVTTKRKEE